jgi:pentatricopeptide repeat protein
VGDTYARGRQMSEAAKYFNKMNFKNDVPNEKKI